MHIREPQAGSPGDSLGSVLEMGACGSSDDQLVPVYPELSWFQHYKFHVLGTHQSQENHLSSGPIPPSFHSMILGCDLVICLFIRFPRRFFCTRRFKNHCRAAVNGGGKEQAEGGGKGKVVGCLHLGSSVPSCMAGPLQPVPEEQEPLSGRARDNTRYIQWLLHPLRPSRRSGVFCNPRKDLIS